MDRKAELEKAFREDDEDSLLRAAREGSPRVVRFLCSRLSSPEEAVRQKSVRSLGVVLSQPAMVPRDKVRDLLRRFFWALNDESGAVPFGVPEAIGEVLAVRPELQPDYLPLLCSLAYHRDVVQTGIIERGVFWALGRVGQAVALNSPEAVREVSRAAQDHPDPETRRAAAWALGRIGAS